MNSFVSFLVMLPSYFVLGLISSKLGGIGIVLFLSVLYLFDFLYKRIIYKKIIVELNINQLVVLPLVFTGQLILVFFLYFLTK